MKEAMDKTEFKLTEVGVIPRDWIVKPIGKIVVISVGRDLKKENYSQDQDSSYKYPVYSNTISNEGLYGFCNIFEYSGESLTVVGRGVGLGTAFKRNWEYGAIGRLLVLIPHKNIDAKYLTEFINYKINVFFESSGIPQLTGISFAKYKVALPPTKAEQTAIATALNDADALITKLEKLITKKRNIKQGAMQELLKPKEGWEMKKLGEVADIDTDNLGADTNPSYAFHYISLEDVDHGVLKNITEYVFCNAPSRARRKIKKSDILFSTVRPNLKSHLLIKEVVPNWICSTGFSVLRCRENIASCEYVFHHLFASTVNNQIETLISGSNYPAINSKDVKSLQIPIPHLEEQTRIAQILSDMDAEIEALEKKLDKYKMIKQGMMQNLLTGKIRLV